MGKPEYDNQGNVIKKKFKIKIAGFTIGMGQIIAIIALIAFIMLMSFISSERKRKADQIEYERQMAELDKILAAQQQGGEELDIHAQIQASLTKTYGVAPEGFEWDYAGGLVAIGNDDDHNCEDVVYMFLRSLSMLDFSTAARYSSDSTIINTYQNYYGVTSEAITDYYRNFLRKQLKVSITSLEVEGISDVAVFADGTEYLTITVKVLDLTDKDFWEKDRDALFEQLRVYTDTEADSTKVEQSVYNYIYDKYLDGTVGKKSCTIELVVSKNKDSGWLVSGDKELAAYLQYEHGVDVARYILDEYSKWYMEITLQEQTSAAGGSANGYSGDTKFEEDIGEPDIYEELPETEPPVDDGVSSK